MNKSYSSAKIILLARLMKIAVIKESPSYSPFVLNADLLTLQPHTVVFSLQPEDRACTQSKESCTWIPETSTKNSIETLHDPHSECRLHSLGWGDRSPDRHWSNHLKSPVVFLLSHRRLSRWLLSSKYNCPKYIARVRLCLVNPATVR